VSESVLTGLEKMSGRPAIGCFITGFPSYVFVAPYRKDWLYPKRAAATGPEESAGAQQGTKYNTQQAGQI
jgi:hypothetical protein